MDNSLPARAGFSRLYLLACLALLFLGINLVTRFVLQISFPETLPFSIAILPGLAKGLINDCATLTFIMLPAATLIFPPTDTFLRSASGKIYSLFLLFSYAALLIFTAFSEYFFWDEFSSRFNFIAVDYLVYTTEMLRNIMESYPIGWLMLVICLLACATTALMWKMTQRRYVPKYLKATLGGECPSEWKVRLTTLGGLYAAAALVYMLFTPLAGTHNRFWNEYSKNGAYEIFSAYFNNQLDYRAFYKTMNGHDAFALMQREVARADGISAPMGEDRLIRTVESSSPEQKPNVVIVLMESMGKTWLGEHTPNLSRLAAEGLSFEHLMSTGTRTVRGIEALMLSVPPTPGNSIVRRPNSDGLFSLGTIFHSKGYDSRFIYGGYSYFDNMGGFFSGNGYQIVDKSVFDAKNKTFATAWGQCDEDLFAESLLQADTIHAQGKPFHQVLLTTSNHRPFTYPEGKVARPSGSSRTGAVEYSDYAIGVFMREAEKKPWFDNTVFVFVGDHPAAIAGKTAIPPNGYGITCIMYGPRFFAAEKVETLCSQMDVGPTLLASLGWGYRSQFFGTNARTLPAEAGRAWISTYQLLGFRTNDQIVVLSPNGQSEVADVRSSRTKPAPGAAHEVPGGAAYDKKALIARAVASYQCAYDLFVSKEMKEEAVAAYVPPAPSNPDPTAKDTNPKTAHSPAPEHGSPQAELQTKLPGSPLLLVGAPLPEGTIPPTR